MVAPPVQDQGDPILDGSAIRSEILLGTSSNSIRLLPVVRRMFMALLPVSDPDSH